MKAPLRGYYIYWAGFLPLYTLAFPAFCSAQFTRTQTSVVQVVYFNDFNANPGTIFPEWSSPGYTYWGDSITGRGTQPVTNVSSPNLVQRFLGEFGGPALVQPGNKANIRVEDTVRLSLDSLPPHKSLTIEFDLYILKSWDGNSPLYGPDRFALSVEGGPVLIDKTFSNNPKTDSDGSLQDFPSPGCAPQLGAYEVGTLGYNSFFKDSMYHLKFTFAHTADSVRLNFSSSLFEGKGTDDESWGLDNVRVTSIN